MITMIARNVYFILYFRNIIKLIWSLFKLIHACTLKKFIASTAPSVENAQHDPHMPWLCTRDTTPENDRKWQLHYPLPYIYLLVVYDTNSMAQNGLIVLV